MGKHIATCGHEVDGGGIHLAIKGMTRDCKPCTDYVTYCAKCTYDAWNRRDTYDKDEITKLIDMAQGNALPGINK